MIDLVAGEQWIILRHLAVAAVLGGLIGFEREAADKPAGLRTHILVAAASALFVSLGDVVVERFTVEGHSDAVRADPIRLIEAVITGVSFLGAGTILRWRGEDGSAVVAGLTTGASLLFTAGIGACVALSQWILAVGATVLAAITLRLLGRLEHRLELS